MEEKFAEVFSSLRRESGLNQREAAAELGISQALLSHYENGLREPRLAFVVKACEYYGVSADYMLGLTEKREDTLKVDRIAAEAAERCLALETLLMEDEFRDGEKRELCEAALKLARVRWLRTPGKDRDTVKWVLRHLSEDPEAARAEARQAIAELEGETKK